LEIGEELLETARGLDRHYLQTRYVNAYPSGAPVDYYREEDAEEALRGAERVAAFTEKSL